MIIIFGKVTIPDNSVIFRDSYGNVTKCLTFDAANDNYEIAAQREYKKEDNNLVQAKVKKEKTK